MAHICYLKNTAPFALPAPSGRKMQTCLHQMLSPKVIHWLLYTATKRGQGIRATEGNFWDHSMQRQTKGKNKKRGKKQKTSPESQTRMFIQK